MADGVVLNAGSGGSTAATDDCGASGHAQIVKLAISTDGSATAIPAEATNGLDVDVTRVIPGVTATALGKAEDAAAASGDTGVPALAVRRDTAAVGSGTDGDYSSLNVDANGLLWVNGSGVTQPVSNAGLTELAAAINASSQVDVQIAACAVTVPVSNAGTFAVQATIAAGATTIAKAEDAAHSSGDVGVPALTVRQDTAAALAGTDADYQPLITDSSGRLHVNVGNTVTVGSHAVTNAGTFATQVDGAALTALQLIDDTVFAEDVAAQAADKGIAILAVRRDADTSLVGADNDYANLQVNAAGSLKVAITAGAGSGGTSLADDAPFTAATTSFTPVGGIVTADSVDSGDGGAFAMLANRQQKVTLYDSGGSELAVGGGTQYTEDAAAAANPIGNALIVIREDARAGSLTTTDGDNVALRGNNLGELYVKHTDALTVNSHAVTNAGTFAVQNNAATPAGTNNIGDVDVLTIAAGDNNIGNVDIVSLPASTNTLEVVGDAAHDAAAAGNPVLVGGYASAAAPTGVSADADVVRAWHLLNGAQATVITAAGALIGGDATNGLDVDVTRLPALVAGTANIGDVDVLTLPNVTLAAGTNTNEVVGDAAHDAAAAGNPVLIGGYATNNIEGLTQVAAADAARIITDLNGVIVTRPHTTPEEFLQTTQSVTATTSTAATNFGAVASVRNYVTSVTVWNSSATDTFVRLQDGSGGADLAVLPAPQTGGGHYVFPVPIKTTANTALYFAEGATASTVYVTIVGYQAKG